MPYLFAVAVVMITIIVLTYFKFRKDEIGEHFDSSQRALGNVLCRCGRFYVPSTGATRKEGIAHTVRLCFPEREEINGNKE